MKSIKTYLAEERTPSGKDTKNPVTREWKVSLRGEKKSLANFAKELDKLFTKYIPETNDGYIENLK